MKSADLEAELTAAVSAVTRSDRDALHAAGVPEAVITDGLVGTARIELDHGRLYRPNPDADNWAFITPVRTYGILTPESPEHAETVRSGALIDLIAWDPEFPRQWVLRAGLAGWAGAVEPQYLGPDPVPIWRTPYDWLRSDCTGLVLLGDRQERWRVLSSLDRIEAEDAEHRAELLAILRQPWPVFPRIAIKGARNAA